MIRIDPGAWDTIAAQAESLFPNECCGAMLGEVDGDRKRVRVAVPIENAFTGSQAARYELRPEDLLAAAREARKNGMDLIGIFHSYPDCNTYFSVTDLKNSCPWYSFRALSVKAGACGPPNAFPPHTERTET